MALSLGHLYNSDEAQKGGQVTKPIIVGKIPWKLIVCQVAKGFLTNNFLASVNINDFCHICNAINFLLGLMLLHPRV